jgi:hypothetical protein
MSGVGLSSRLLQEEIAMIVFDGNLMDSPFVVPVIGCIAGGGIAITAIWSGVRSREMQSQERLAAIARGLPMPPTVEELAMQHEAAKPITSRRRGNTRRAGIVLLGVAGGLILFFVALAAILQLREVLAGAAAGLIPFGIGIGLLVDAKMQSKELDATPPAETAAENSTALRPFDY